MDLLSKLKHPAWGWLIVPLVLAIIATFTPSAVRVCLLVATVIAVASVYHQTAHGGKRWGRTGVVVGVCLVIAIGVFFLGRLVDARSNPKDTTTTTGNKTPDHSTPAPEGAKGSQGKLSATDSTSASGSPKKAKQARSKEQAKAIPAPKSDIPTPNVHAPASSTQSSQSGTAVGTVNVQPGAAVTFGQQGGTNIGQQLVVTPPTRYLIEGVAYLPEVIVPTAFVNGVVVDGAKKPANVTYVALRLSERSQNDHLEARVEQARTILSANPGFMFFDASRLGYGYALKTLGRLSGIGGLDYSGQPGVYYLRAELKDTADATQKLLEVMGIKISAYRHVESEEEIRKRNLPGETSAIERYKFWTASGIDIEICLWGVSCLYF